MRILVGDDNNEKRRQVVQLLNDALAFQRVRIGEAANYEEALEALRSGFFDLVVLDLLLPAAGAPPSEQTSRALIRQILAGDRLVPPMHIIGLTAYPEVGRAERRFYDEHLFALEHYDPESGVWADRLAAKISYLIRAKNAGYQFQAHNHDIDVFVLAARHENEYRPIRSRLFKTVDASSHPLWNGELSLGKLKLSDGRNLTCGLACIGEMGMASAATVASQAIAIFRPRLLGMLGICCGFGIPECSAPRRLMDAIVVRDVTCWEEGKYVDQVGSTNEFRNRAKVRVVDDKIRNVVDSLVDRYAEDIAPQLRKLAQSRVYRDIRAHFGGDMVRLVPDVKFASMVTGSSVIADEEMIREIIDRHPAALGLDMETFGVYAAAERCFGRRPSVLAVKGVADFGTKEKDDRGQKGATIVATEVFKALLPNLGLFDNDD